MTEEFQSNTCLLSMQSKNLKLQLFTQHFCGKLVRSARKGDQCAAEQVHVSLVAWKNGLPLLLLDFHTHTWVVLTAPDLFRLA